MPTQQQHRSATGCRVPRAGLTLIELILSVLLVLVVGITVALLGVGEAIHLFYLFAALLAVAAVWGRCYAGAPEATKNVTVLVFVAVCLLQAGASWLQSSRKQARRAQAIDNLRAISLGMHAHDEIQNGSGRPFTPTQKQTRPAAAAGSSYAQLLDQLGWGATDNKDNSDSAQNTQVDDPIDSSFTPTR